MSHTIVGREFDPLETRGRRQFRRLVQVEPDDCIALDQLCDDRPADEAAASRDDDNVSVSHPGLLKGYRYAGTRQRIGARSEEHTSELQSLMRLSYAVFCLKKKNILPASNRRIK